MFTMDADAALSDCPVGAATWKLERQHFEAAPLVAAQPLMQRLAAHMRTDVDEKLILDLNRRFHDEFEASNYDQRMAVSHDEASVERMVAELERVLGRPLPQGRVLDVGSGTGNVAVKLAATRRYDSVVATDISRRSLDMAQQSARALGCDLEIVESDMSRLPFADNSFDLVVGCAFLHHLPDPVRFMKEVRRVLRPGCPFVFIGEPTRFAMSATNVIKSPLVLLNRVFRGSRGIEDQSFRWDHDNIDVHVFTKRDAQAMLDGFENQRIVTEGFALPICDQGLFTPIRTVLGRNIYIDRSLRGMSKVLALSDELVFNHVLPRMLKVSLKISGEKPRLA
jgi:ubiquinone/menaquinone biosynthesis C-methylase UbiE